MTTPKPDPVVEIEKQIAWWSEMAPMIALIDGPNSPLAQAMSGQIYLLRELKELRAAVKWYFNLWPVKVHGLNKIDIEEFAETETDKHHAQVLLKAITAEKGE